MSEKEHLLSYSSESSGGPLGRVRDVVTKAEDAVKKPWIRFVKLLHAREFFAEFVATFMLIIIGDGAIAQAVLSAGADGYELSINIGYGFGVMLGCYIAGGITGGHMNPAVTLAMALRAKTSWLKVIPYWIAQFLGAFFASAVLYGVYVDAITHSSDRLQGDPNCFINQTFVPKLPLCTGKIWATYPIPNLSLAEGFLDQVVGTFLLVLGIFAICDSRNTEPKAGLKPLLIGLLLWAIGGSFGFNCGYAINPARDFAPRAFTAMAGWGKDVFVCSQCSIRHWWWVPVVAPMIGGAIAAPFYWFLIEAHHPAVVEDSSYGPVNAVTDQHRQQRPHNY